MDVIKEWIKGKQFVSSDCEDQISRQHSLKRGIIPPSWYSPLHGDLPPLLFWNLWYTYWVDSIFIFFSQTYQWESVRSGILISNLRIVWGNIRCIARVTKSANKENITWISEKNLTCQREISWHPLSIPSSWSLDCPFLQDKTNPLLSILTNVHSHLRKGVVIMIRYFSEDRKIAILLSTFCFTTPRNSLSTYKYHQNWYVVSYLMYILNVRKK